MIYHLGIFHMRHFVLLSMMTLTCDCAYGADVKMTVNGGVYQSDRHVAIAVSTAELTVIADHIRKAIDGQVSVAESDIPRTALSGPPGEVIITYINEEGVSQKPMRFFVYGSKYLKTNDGLYYSFEYGWDLCELIQERIDQGKWISLE